jgi:hypothetical protein
MEDLMEERSQQTNNWPELAISLYDRLTGRGAEITYEFENMEVAVPSSTDGNAARANWRLNGVLKIRARDRN